MHLNRGEQMGYFYTDEELAHHGIKGQDWGKRRYQYEDGSLTPLGRIHYGVGEARDRAKIKMREEKAAAKNEVKIAKAKAKAEVARIKAEAQAYKMKRDAESQAERDRIKADKEVEKERIAAEREAERNVSEENREIAKREAKTQVELAELANKGNEEKRGISTAAKVGLGILAGAGIAYLLHKSIKGNKTEDISEETVEKGGHIINSFKEVDIYFKEKGKRLKK